MGEDLLSCCLHGMLSYCLNMLQVISTSYPLWVAVLSIAPFGLLCMQALTASSVQVMERLMNFQDCQGFLQGIKLVHKSLRLLSVAFRGSTWQYAMLQCSFQNQRSSLIS